MINHEKSLYDWLTNINSLELHDKSVLVIGGGWMANEYCKALSSFRIKDVTVISQSKDKVNKLCDKYGFYAMDGGYEKNLSQVKKMDLVIICTPIHLLLPATELSIETGQNNILIEKPASLYHEELMSLSRKLSSQRVRISYNRLMYTNFHKLKYLSDEDGGITSCHFSFTEWIHTINFEKEKEEVYQRWGISNSSHVISMAIELIGMPRELFTFQSGKLKWHPSGAIFVGGGISEKDIPFSYHANWISSGRWGIEVMTRKHAYRLIPLEELYRCEIGSVNWQKVDVNIAFPKIKQGISEEIALMLSNNARIEYDLPSLEKAASYNKLCEKIFKYS